MLRMGRPREKGKNLPLGVYPVKGRYYVRPVNREMRRIFAVAFPGKRCAATARKSSPRRSSRGRVLGRSCEDLRSAR